MMSGKAISRAIRGLLLVNSALHTLIMSEIYGTEILPCSADDGVNSNDPLFNLENSDPKLMEIASLLDNTMSNAVDVSNTIDNNTIILDIQNRMATFKSQLEQSKTARLWLMFMEMVSIMCKHIKAQRSGNWILHLESVSEMLPYFGASGIISM